MADRESSSLGLSREGAINSAFNIPAGFALVPLEPTREMLCAWRDANETDAYFNTGKGIRHCYEAMLDAAPPVDAVPGEPVARDWELTCDECAGTGKVDVSEAMHVDGRYMGDQLLRETCNACTGYGFTICVADIPQEIQQ